MRSREEPLTSRERKALLGYVSWATTVGRAVLFVIALAIVAAIAWRINQRLPLPGYLWLLPTLGVGAWLYIASGRWTGGPELRNKIRRDLDTGTALVHSVVVRDAIVFEENEDEGPVVFLLTDEDETLVFLGQDLAHQVSRGFPWREFEIRESASSRRFFRLQRIGEPMRPSRSRPPLSREHYLSLGLGSVRVWQRLEVPFDRLQKLA